MATTDGASSISVAVRVRPFTIREAAQVTRTDDTPLFLGEGSLAGAQQPKLHQKGIRSIIKVVDDRCLVFDPPEDNPVHRFSKSVVPQFRRVKDQTFAFDRVFDDNTSQGDVYEATTRGLLDSVLDGYNATVFAYGATGCGKTHTITGTVQQPGIIFLTMQELFERVADLQEDKVTEISLSYLEIYNETIRDLLEPNGTKGGLMLREDANQVVSVPGLSSHTPKNVQEVMDMVVQGNECRTQSPTDANATSSRSHAVLQVNVSQRERNANINEAHTMATLSIIDLAGSERASATKNRGERLIEGANINKSLLALGSCINALCDPRKKNHVPYRNSKLTRLLKFSLGGNCKTVMIVCVSPSSAHFDETQNTLRYANRAKNIQTKVSRNVFNVNRHVKDYLKKIDEQMAQINELQEKLKDYEGVAFVKFRKQIDKRDAVLHEGIARLRNAYEHTQEERQKRMFNLRKLRQVERRISILTAWIAGFDKVCEMHEDDEPPKNLSAMRMTAEGIRMELETSRHHFHQLMSKNTWQRPIDTALHTGLDQLRDTTEGADVGSEASTLEKEAQLLIVNADRELYMSTLEHEKAADSAVTQILLQAHFETITTLDQLLSMSEADAVQAAKKMLHKMLTACTDATAQAIKPDASMPVTETLSAVRTGTPKRKRASVPVGPTPAEVRLSIPTSNGKRLSVSPMKASPKRRLLGSARKSIALTPKKRAPSKRSVRWRDDADEGELAEYEKTPQQQELTPPDTASSDIVPPLPSLPEMNAIEEEGSSPPIPPPPQASIDILSMQPKSTRFQTGFLSRKGNGSPAPSTLGRVLSSSPDASPLQETSANRSSGRLSLQTTSQLFPETLADKECIDNATRTSASSDSERENTGSAPDCQVDDAEGNSEQIKEAVKRASESRRSSLRDQNRVHRRRSPPPANSGSSPTMELSLASSAQTRRLARIGERDSPLKVSTPGVSLNGTRRVTLADERAVRRPSTRGSTSSTLQGTPKMSTGAGLMSGRGSLSAAAKSTWR